MSILRASDPTSAPTDRTYLIALASRHRESTRSTSPAISSIASGPSIDHLVIGRLSQPDAAIVLGVPGKVDIAALQTRREVLRGLQDEAAVMFARQTMRGAQFERATAELQVEIDDLDAELAAARASSSIASLVLAGDDLRATWNGTSPDIRGKIIDALMAVTVMPSNRGRTPGGKYFDPSSVRIEMKG